MKLTTENILELPVSKEDKKLLLSLLDDVSEINRITGKELHIDWQDYHNEYSAERTDPCPDDYGTYSLVLNEECIGERGLNINLLDYSLCLLYGTVIKLFNENPLNRVQNLSQCFKSEVGEGWWPLIDEAFSIITSYNRKHLKEEPIKFYDIKEKWGGLVLSVTSAPKEILDKLERLEDESYTICEHCGTKENVETKESRGWIFTLCDNCRKEAYG